MKILAKVEVIEKKDVFVVVDDSDLQPTGFKQVSNKAVEKAKQLHENSSVIESEYHASEFKKLPSDLTSDHLTLLECGYPLEKIMNYSAEDAEAEFEAIPLSQ